MSEAQLDTTTPKKPAWYHKINKVLVEAFQTGATEDILNVMYDICLDRAVNAPTHELHAQWTHETTVIGEALCSVVDYRKAHNGWKAPDGTD